MIRDSIKKAMEKRGMSKYELARRIGVNPSNVGRFLDGEQSMTISNLEKVFHELDLKISLNDK